MMKKTLALILAISLLSSFTIAHASTESDTVMDSGTVETQEKEEVAIGVTSITEASGSFGENTFDVDTYESFDFPGSFQIDPSAGELKGTPVEVTNAGETSINLTAELCKSMDSSSPSVVRPDHFADWTTITTEETTSNIAFGFLVKNEAGEETAIFWFADEDSQATEKVYTVAPGETVTVEIIGKHGLSWEKACTLSYDCKVGIEVIPLEIVAEPPLEVVPPVEPEVIKPEEVLPEESITENDILKEGQIEGGETEDDISKEGQPENDILEEGQKEDKKPEEGQSEEPSTIPCLPEVAPPVVNDKEQVEEAIEESVPAEEDKAKSDTIMNEQEDKETETAVLDENTEQSQPQGADASVDDTKVQVNSL